MVLPTQNCKGLATSAQTAGRCVKQGSVPPSHLGDQTLFHLYSQMLRAIIGKLVRIPRIWEGGFGNSGRGVKRELCKDMRLGCRF